MLINLFSNAVAVLVTLPFLTTIILSAAAYKISKNKIKSFHFSISYSVLFYIFAVWASIRVLFNKNFIAEILILLLLLMSVSVFIQWKAYGEIKTGKVWKGFWRASFLVFSVFYTGLVIYGITFYLFF